MDRRDFWRFTAVLAVAVASFAACAPAPADSTGAKDDAAIDVGDGGGSDATAGGWGDNVDGPSATACLTDKDCAFYSQKNCRTAKCAANLHCTTVSWPDGAACEDGQVCTKGDTCADGWCNGGADSCGTCAVDGDCQPLGPGNPCNGLYYCADTLAGKACRKRVVAPMIGELPLCLPGCPTAGSPVQHCDWATEKCVDGPHKAPGTCSDANPCTANDHCGGGQCVGQLKLCLDGVSCTKDLCNSMTGQCEHSLVGSACTDGAECNVGAGCLAQIACPVAMVGLGNPPTCTAQATQVLTDQRPAALSADVTTGMALLTMTSDGSGKCKSMQVLHYAESGQFESLRMSVPVKADCSERPVAAALSGQKKRLGVLQTAANETQGQLWILDSQGLLGPAVALPWLTSGERRLLARQPDGWWLVQYNKVGGNISAIPLDTNGQQQGAPVKLTDGSGLPALAVTPSGQLLTAVRAAASPHWQAQWRDAAGQPLGPAVLLDAKEGGASWSNPAVAADDDGTGGLLAWRDSQDFVRVIRWSAAGQTTVKVDLPPGQGTATALTRRGADGWALVTSAYMNPGHQVLALPLSKEAVATGAGVRLDIQAPSGVPFFALGHANGRLTGAWPTQAASTAVRTTGW